MNKAILINGFQDWFLYALLAFAFCLPAQAQPAISWGEQRIPISFQEVMTRADAALRAKEYINIGAHIPTESCVFVC